MRKAKKIFKVLGILGALLIFAPQVSAKAASVYPGDTNTNVWYNSHVQNIGWQGTVSNGDVSGTTGRALNIEAMQIDVSDSAQFSIEYNAYVNTIGWVGVSRDGQTVGTTGKNLPINGICIAIKDKNTKQDSANYDVYYRVHVRDIGWESWTKNGNLAGDTYGAKPIEAIEIQIRPKGQSPVTPGATQREKVINEAYKHLGKPYVWGATGPNSFDCSGFTQYVYKQAVGIDITRTTYTQINVGTAISYSQLQPGDLVFTYNNEHVGIYVGNGQYINAPQPGEVVKVSPITNFYAARSVL